MTYRLTLPSIFTLLSALTAACGTDSASTTQTPAAGTLGGDCLPSGTCDVGLACQQNLCVASGAGGFSGAGAGAGGISTAGSGGIPTGSGGVEPATGGTNNGGATGGTGSVCAPGASQACACTSGMSGAQTCNASGTGFDPCVCSGGTGGNAGSGGSGGSGGACAGSQTDPKNCGTCGHACKGTCTAGKCDPAFGGCFDRSQFDTCDAYCTSIGQLCAQASCKTLTWRSWSPGDEALCATADSNAGQGQGACGDTLPSDTTSHALFNCCCGD